ncbi:AAA family ATPase [Roseovarius sp. S4756]|uniref:AAA family ATPase n=1 Tax=Roseovarius maritimus TaxID=3342637 RepID=UPI003727A7CE
MTQSNTEPKWQPLAQQALERLRSLPGGPRQTEEDDPFTEHALLLDEEPLPEAKAKRRVIAKTSQTDQAGKSKKRIPKPRPHPRTQPRDLTLLFRLCATFGTQSDVDKLLNAGALTLIEVGDASMSAILELFETALFDREVTFGSDTYLPKGAPGSTLVALTLTEPEYRRDTRDQRSKIIAALESPHPVLLLAPSFDQVPRDILNCLPPPQRLAPASRDILLALTRQVYSPSASEARKVQQMLPDPASDLSWPRLAAALRERTAASFAAKVVSLTTQDSRDGPTLADIEGFGAAEDAAQQMVSDLQDWRAGDLAWSEVQRSVLFHGAPGTGKSFLASAMGNSAGVSMVRGSFAAWQAAGHLGDMLKAMRETFQNAVQARPSILVIDEVDALGDRASPEKHNANYTHQVINGFLELMDGLKNLEGLMVVGTCNFPDRIDAAAMRPGRFDLKVEVPLPGAAAIRRMLRDGLPEAIVAPDLEHLVSAAAGRSAAEIDGALRAARTRARSQDRALQVSDLLTQFGAEARNSALEYRIAIHECGHAIVHQFLGMGRANRVALTTTGGGTWVSSPRTEGLIADCENQLIHLLAGRAAERVVLGAPTAGAGGSETSDLAQATRKAAEIDTKLGLGAEGLAWTDLDHSLYLHDPENAARVRDRLESAEARAISILSAHEALLKNMGNALFKARMLEGEALEYWMRKIEAANDGKGAGQKRRMSGPAFMPDNPTSGYPSGSGP